MKVEKRKLNKEPRAHLASGFVNDKEFAVSLLCDGSGIILEFDDEAYFVSLDSIVTEIIASLDKLMAS
jgi:hypothetical protein